MALASSSEMLWSISCMRRSTSSSTEGRSAGRVPAVTVSVEASPPGNFENQGCGEGRGRKNIVGINSALEAVGGIRSEEKAARSAADFRSGEVGGFEKDVGGAFADSAIESSHHAGEGKGGLRFRRR